jgi:hypothetical protein
MPLVMVLDDGETFTNLKDCKIVEVPEDTEEVKGMGYPVVCKFEEAYNGNILVYWKHTSTEKKFVEFGSVLREGS